MAKKKIKRVLELTVSPDIALDAISLVDMPAIEENFRLFGVGDLYVMARMDADDFYMSVVADEHWRKVCGLSALYTALRLIKILKDDASTPGQLLTYGQAEDPLGGVVSFASAIYR